MDAITPTFLNFFKNIKNVSEAIDALEHASWYLQDGLSCFNPKKEGHVAGLRLALDFGKNAASSIEAICATNGWWDGYIEKELGDLYGQIGRAEKALGG